MDRMIRKAIYGQWLSFILLLTVVLATGCSGLKPTALDYGSPSRWCYWEEGREKRADLFLVCPTVDLGKAGNLLGDVEDASFRRKFRGALNMEIALYSPECTVYAPFYRQVTLAAYRSAPAVQEKNLQKAYRDVRAAFVYYLRHASGNRPLVLAGFSQGADMALRLLKEFGNAPEVGGRLVAAYIIGWRVTEEELAAFPHLKMAQGEEDTGCIVCFNSEAEDVTDSLMVPAGMRTRGINPLNWRTDAVPAEKTQNRGACFTDYTGKITREVPALCGAYLSPERGTLKVTGITPKEYPGILFADGIYHLYDYQFFFRNIQENVRRRVQAFLAQRPASAGK